MNKTKILAFIAIAAMLAACGSDDGSPPSLKNSNIGFISPFDTLKVEFDSKIVNINELDISPSIDMVRLLDGEKSKISFIGKGSTPGGWHNFGDDLKDESITFKNLKNTDGYVTASTELKFSTYPVYDKEPNDVVYAIDSITKDTTYYASDLKPFLSTSAKKVIFAGILDHKFEINKDGDTLDVKKDAADFYTLDLKETETISITASSYTAPFKVRFYGECHRPKAGCLDDTLTITKELVKDKKSAALSKIIPGGHWPEGATTGSKTAFYIKIFDGNLLAPTNPYILEVGIK